MRELRQWVWNAARRPEVCSAVEQIYLELEQAVAARKPICVLSGRCCRFEEYGHRLYVTTMELAAFASHWLNEDDPVLMLGNKWNPPDTTALVQVSHNRPKSEKIDSGEVLSGEVRLAMQLSRWTGKGCPYQVRELCGAHGIRPMGCRIFFCDSSSKQWQSDQYEKFHSRLRHLHDSMNVPYLYLNWQEALAFIG